VYVFVVPILSQSTRKDGAPAGQVTVVLRGADLDVECEVMVDEVSKAPTQERVHCNRCRHDTLHRLVRRAVDEHTDWFEHGEIDWRIFFDLLQCCGCGEAVLRRTSSSSEDPDPDVRFFPPPVSRHPPRWKYKLPSEMRDILEEVYRSLDANTRTLPMM